MHRFLVAVIFAAPVALAGCASKPDGPLVHNVCIEVAQETPQEIAYVRRKAFEYLKQYGFNLAETECEVSVKYERFGNFQAETVVTGFLWKSSSGYWSQEGILAVNYKGRMLVEDQSMNLRGYSSKQDLLNDLAWAVVKPVTRMFRPASPPPK